jgi:hypothetical protein
MVPGECIVQASRVPWSGGPPPPPPGAEVYRRCAAPHCVKPDHLISRLAAMTARAWRLIAPVRRSMPRVETADCYGVSLKVVL